jgi:hypothetical protein
MRYWKFHLKKFCGTATTMIHVGMARSFGTYKHSSCTEIGEEWFNYAVYEWRGKLWMVPTGPAENDEVQS